MTTQNMEALLILAEAVASTLDEYEECACLGCLAENKNAPIIVEEHYLDSVPQGAN